MTKYVMTYDGYENAVFQATGLSWANYQRRKTWLWIENGYKDFIEENYDRGTVPAFVARKVLGAGKTFRPTPKKQAA